MTASLFSPDRPSFLLGGDGLIVRADAYALRVSDGFSLAFPADEDCEAAVPAEGEFSVLHYGRRLFSLSDRYAGGVVLRTFDCAETVRLHLDVDPRVRLYDLPASMLGSTRCHRLIFEPYTDRRFSAGWLILILTGNGSFDRETGCMTLRPGLSSLIVTRGAPEVCHRLSLAALNASEKLLPPPLHPSLCQTMNVLWHDGRFAETKNPALECAALTLYRQWGDDEKAKRLTALLCAPGGLEAHALFPASIVPALAILTLDDAQLRREQMEKQYRALCRFTLPFPDRAAASAEATLLFLLSAAAFLRDYPDDAYSAAVRRVTAQFDRLFLQSGRLYDGNPAVSSRPMRFGYGYCTVCGQRRWLENTLCPACMERGEQPPAPVYIPAAPASSRIQSLYRLAGLSAVPCTPSERAGLVPHLWEESAWEAIDRLCQSL